MTSPVADPIAIIKNVLHAEATPQHYWGGSGSLRSGGGGGGGGSRHSSTYVTRGYAEKTQHRGSSQMFLGDRSGGLRHGEHHAAAAHPSSSTPLDTPAPPHADRHHRHAHQALPPHCSGLEEHLEFHRQSVIGTVFPQASLSSAAGAVPPAPVAAASTYHPHNAPGTPVSQLQRRGHGVGSSGRVLDLPRSPLLDSPRTPSSALDYGHHHRHHAAPAAAAVATPASREIGALKQLLLEPSAADTQHAGWGGGGGGRSEGGGGANLSIVSEAYNCIQQPQPQQQRSSALRRPSAAAAAAALPPSDSLALQLLETQTELIALLKSTGVTGFPLPSSPPRDAATGRHAVPPAQHRHNSGNPHGRSVQYGDDYEVSRSVSGRGAARGGSREQVRTPRTLHGGSGGGGGGGGGGWTNPYPVPHDYTRRGITTPRDNGSGQSAPPARYSSSVAYLRESR